MKYNDDQNWQKKLRLTALASSCIALMGCSNTMDRLSNIGQPPEMSKIENPTRKPEYQPVSLPMPSPEHVTQQKNSLWASNRQTFFKDQRATEIGDILTVVIDIKDDAKVDNETERSRSSSEGADLPALLGYEQALGRVLPQAIDATDLVDFGSSSSSTGAGTVEREEEINVQLAALITQILPNGNLVINGRQEVLVNFEKRILQIDGVIRPEDISTDNTISYQQIAEARIIYGGEGHITDVQQPRYGQQLYDIVFPF